MKRLTAQIPEYQNKLEHKSKLNEKTLDNN